MYDEASYTMICHDLCHFCQLESVSSDMRHWGQVSTDKTRSSLRESFVIFVCAMSDVLLAKKWENED